MSIASVKNSRDITSIAGQLAIIYLKEEWWHTDKMSLEDAVTYHKKGLQDGTMIYELINFDVVGYCEFWRLNFEQWGRYVCKEKIFFDEDKTKGNVCVVNNVWIREDLRRGEIFKKMMRKFYQQNSDCDYYVGHALRKKTQPIKIFKRTELQSKLFVKGVS